MQKRPPKIAIVGRPNVGKSALFNRICQRRIAIVEDIEGITRDRLVAQAELFGRQLEMIDTGGIDSKSRLPFHEEVRLQTLRAIDEADVLVMVVDGMGGPTALDQEVASLLLRQEKPIVLAVNKIDSIEQKYQVHQFHSLGIKQMVPISATHGFQVVELLEEALKGVDLAPVRAVKTKPLHLAILGRPNVGKSTLVNYITDEQRCAVSPIAGTTRDSIDIPIEVNGKEILLIDTAGVRRKKSEHDVVDKFAAIRTERALDRADVVILLLDAQEGITAQEKKIAQDIEAEGKGCILLFNKWDLVKGFRMEHCLQGIQQEASFLEHCPTLFVSALTGRNLEKLMDLVIGVEQECKRRITTGQLNKFVEKALQKYHPPMIKGKRLRIYYLTQVSVHPCRFLLFVNHPDLMTETYKKYLINQFREEYGFKGAPLFFSLKGKKEQEEHERLHPHS